MRTADIDALAGNIVETLTRLAENHIEMTRAHCDSGNVYDVYFHMRESLAAQSKARTFARQYGVKN